MLFRRDYLISRFAPLVSFRASVGESGKGIDAGFEFRNGAIYAALQLVSRRLGEAQFDLIYPGYRR